MRNVSARYSLLLGFGLPISLYKRLISRSCRVNEVKIQVQKLLNEILRNRIDIVGHTYEKPTTLDSKILFSSLVRGSRPIRLSSNQMMISITVAILVLVLVLS